MAVDADRVGNRIERAVGDLERAVGDLDSLVRALRDETEHWEGEGGRRRDESGSGEAGRPT